MGPPGGIEELGAEDEADEGAVLELVAVCEPVWTTLEIWGCELDAEDEEAAPLTAEEGAPVVPA